MRRQPILKPLVWLCLFFFLFAQLPVEKQGKEFYLASPSPFVVQEPAISPLFDSNFKKPSFFSTALLSLSLFWGPVLFSPLIPEALNYSVVSAQESKVEKVEALIKDVYTELKQIRINDAQAVEMKKLYNAPNKRAKEAILKKLKNVKKTPNLTVNKEAKEKYEAVFRFSHLGPKDQRVKLRRLREKSDRNLQNIVAVILPKIKALNHISAIQNLLELLESTSIDYGHHDLFYKGILETLLSIIESNKERKIYKLGIKRYWKLKPNEPHRWMTFYQFPKNVRVKEIPKYLFKEMVRRMEYEADNGSAGTVTDFLTSRIAGQSFKLYTLGAERSFYKFEPKLFEKAIELSKQVSTFFYEDFQKYTKSRIFLAAIEATGDLPIKTSKELQFTLGISKNLRGFLEDRPKFKNKTNANQFMTALEKKLSPFIIKQRLIHKKREKQQQLIAKNIILKPESILPVADKETFWIWGLILSLFGTGISLFVFWKKNNLNKEGNHDGTTVEVDTVKDDTLLHPKSNLLKKSNGRKRISNKGRKRSSSKIKPKTDRKKSKTKKFVLPVLPEKKVGPFTLKKVVKKVSEGLLREGTVLNKGNVVSAKLVEKGPYLMLYSLSGKETQKFLFEGGPFLRGAFSEKGGKWQKEPTPVAFKGNYVIFPNFPKKKKELTANDLFSTPNQTSSFETEKFIELGVLKKKRRVYHAAKVDEKTGMVEQDKEVIIEGDLIVETAEDTDRKKSIAPLYGGAFRAYLASEEREVIVTPFVTDEKIYWLTKKLGEGGMGEVYQAWDPILDRYVAIKFNPTNDSEQRRRFMLEAKSTADINHSNVVNTYKYGLEPVPYISMEFLPGESLEKLKKRKQRLSLEEILENMIPVLEGLRVIHKKGIIHRDLKPANIVWIKEEEQRMVLTDFGLARKEGGENLTRTGDVMGTYAYMPPEQAKGDNLKVGHRADLYSFGALLYVLATAEDPYSAETLTYSLSSAQQHKKGRRPVTEWEGMPIEFEEFLSKLMAYSPEKRYQSASSALRDFEKIKESFKKGTLTFKRNGKEQKPILVSLIVSVVASIIFLVMPFLRQDRLPKGVTPFAQLKEVDLEEALSKLKEEIKKLKGVNKSVQTYQLAYKKYKKAKKSSDKEVSKKLFQEALNDLKKALKKLDNIELILLKIKIYGELGQTSEAIQEIEKIKESLEESQHLTPELEELQEVLEKLLKSLNKIAVVPSKREQLNFSDLTPFELSA